MDTSSKILILTAQYGNGHFQVAKTVQDAFQRRGFQNVTVCDLFEESHPRLTNITRYLYLKSYTVGKRIYRMFYYGADKIYDKKIASLYSSIGRNRLINIIEQENPDVIINTFPIAAVPELRKQAGYSFRTYNILTDFCLHKMWIHSEIDTYFVATPELKALLGDAGVSADRIEVTGIPIRNHFELELNQTSLYEKYGLSQLRKTLLIVAGAHGVLTNVVQLCQSFCSHEELQVIVVCGNNDTLKEELVDVEANYPDNLSVLGYVERIDELFRISDCLLTKPGGITLSEAAALQVPIVLYKPVPGQEGENAVFFVEKGAAIVVHETENVLTETIALLQDDQRLLRMKKAMLSIHEGDSANKIVSSIGNTIDAEKYSVL